MSEVLERKLRRRSATVCQRCSSDGAQVRTYSDTLEHKGLILDVHGLQTMRCQTCSHEWTTDNQQQQNIELLRAAYAVKREEVRAREGLLIGEQIGSILGALGLSTAEAAALFGGTPDSFAKYVRGESLQSTAMDRLLRLAWCFGQPALESLRTNGRGALPPRRADA